MDGCYQLFFHDLWGEGWVDFNGTNGWIMTQSFDMVTGTGGSAIVSAGGATCIFGCSDSLACNYDYLADLDDSKSTGVFDMAGNYIDTLAISSGCDSILR